MRCSKGYGVPSSRYVGFEYMARDTTANFIFSNCLPLMPVLLDKRSLVSMNFSPYRYISRVKAVREVIIDVLV